MKKEVINHCIICHRIHQLHKPKKSSICVDCCKNLAEIVEREQLRKESVLRKFNN